MDWTGNKKSTYITLGASNHTDKERESNDYYATDPLAIDALASVWDIPKNVWECSCGEGHLSRRLEALGHKVVSTDLIDRGYGKGGVDFLAQKSMPDGCSCILTNPPYKYSAEFVVHALGILPDNGSCAMFLKTTFLEGRKRYENIFSSHPPKFVFQFVNRVLCAKNAEFDEMIAGGGSAVSYAWFVWEKNWGGQTVIKWITDDYKNKYPKLF